VGLWVPGTGIEALIVWAAGPVRQYPNAAKMPQIPAKLSHGVVAIREPEITVVELDWSRSEGLGATSTSWGQWCKPVPRPFTSAVIRSNCGPRASNTSCFLSEVGVWRVYPEHPQVAAFVRAAKPEQWVDGLASDSGRCRANAERPQELGIRAVPSRAHPDGNARALSALPP
jgi:hypothetical protein